MALIEIPPEHISSEKFAALAGVALGRYWVLLELTWLAGWLKDEQKSMRPEKKNLGNCANIQGIFQAQKLVAKKCW